MSIQLILITNNPEIAREAQEAGIDLIMVDLEIIGKADRQRYRDTLISCHTMEDVSAMRSVVQPGRLVVRVNPMHGESAWEINQAIARGANMIMLPMFKTVQEVKAFIQIIGGRAKTCLLLETAQALVRLDEILDVGGIDTVHIGLNDLHLSMGLDFMFELLSGGVVEYIAKKPTERGIPYGFGGIAKIGDGLLPAELILAEHIRLGSEMVILSRAFHERAKSLEEIHSKFSLKVEIEKIREAEKTIAAWTPDQFRENMLKVKECVKEICKERGEALSKS